MQLFYGYNEENSDTVLDTFIECIITEYVLFIYLYN